MKKFKLLAGLTTLFLSGVLIGAMGTWILAERKVMDPLVRGKSGVPGVIVEKLTRELDLDEGQKKRITDIVCESHQAVMELRRRMRPEMDAIFQESRTRMKEELSPEQQKKLDRFFERLEERRAGRDRSLGGKDRPKDPCE